MFDFKKLVIKYLRDAADKIDTGTCEISESEAIDIMKVIAHNPLSKAQACIYLNLRRAQFDNLVREGKIPVGKKRVGYKELVWYEDELMLCKNRNKK